MVITEIVFNPITGKGGGMSIESTEEYYTKQDEFVRYVKKEVNPARKEAGLKELDTDDCRVCFRIIYDFLNPQPSN